MSGAASIPNDSFVHLHLHTQYSLLDGAVRIKELMKKAKGFGMPAVAMTDHGNMFGAIEFYNAALKEGIKPIIGCEVYVAPGSLHDKKAASAKEASSHFTLLAKDEVGYHNLVKLVSAAYLEGYYYKPRVDKALLAQHAQGLIALSGCLKGEVNGHLMADQTDKARVSMASFRDIFAPGDFYVELHDHGMDVQRKCNRGLVELAKEFGLPLVAANDVHFLERAHHEAHDVMICIGTGAMVHDEKRMRYSEELYFKSPQEMRKLFAEFPGAADNTLRVAEKCDLKLDFSTSKYPAYEPPAGKTREEYLRELCREGLRARYGERAEEDASLMARMQYELSVLEKAGFVSYFLIVWDFINYARTQGIPVGPGRGSAAGSMVAYILGITDLDPLRFGLIFERFLNPERVSPPDIDIDFCMERRGEVIEYVKRKYGHRAVSQIVTFGTLSSKAVLKDVCRVLGMSYGDGDRLSKMIPIEAAKPLPLALAKEKNPDLKRAVESESATRQVWEYATILEGLTRGTGVHAAGVVICDRDLDEYIPLARDKEEQVVTQYSGGPLNDLGLLKMDFLGLKTLTLIEDALELIHAREPDFDLEAIQFDDPKTVDMLNRGETVGVFQLESGGMTSVCKQFAITGIDDIIAILSLYRPGPMDLIPDYIRRKKGLAKIKYEHPLLKQVCADTFGIMIYQEQVQRAANVLAGYSLGQADLLRRAMGKKDKEKMAKERVNFIKGCAETNQIGEDKANTIFDLLEKFAGYGFNKSHAAAYALITWRTAFLKANYPVEFMAALLSNAINDTDKISIFVSECQRMSIPICPPDVNQSLLKFAPENTAVAAKLDKAVAGAITRTEAEEGDCQTGDCEEGSCAGIRFGLAAIKNVGEGAMASAVEERSKNGPFASLEDFCNRLDSRAVNKKVLESLVRCGAFDFTRQDRAQMFAQIDPVMAGAAITHQDRARGQGGLFDDFGAAPATPKKTPLQANWNPWTNAEKLAFEKELLGFYVTGHPLNPYRSILMGGRFTPLAQLGTLEDRSDFRAAGSLTEVSRKFTKKDGKPFAIIRIEDLSGSVEAMIWNDVFTKCSKLLEVGQIVSIAGRVDLRNEELRVVINEVTQLKVPKPAATEARTGPVRLRLEMEHLLPGELGELRDILAASPGECPVELEFLRADGQRLLMKAGPTHRIKLTPQLEQRLAGRLVAN